MAAPVMAKFEREALIEGMPRMPQVQFDKRQHFTPADFGDIGEDAQGVWVRRTPEVMLLERPDLLAVFDKYTSGQTTLTERDWDELSAPEYEAKLWLIDCDERRAWEQLERRAKR